LTTRTIPASSATARGAVPFVRETTILYELTIIFALIVVNGLFAGAEIALLTLRQTRLHQLLERGSGAARAIQSLRNDPERFLATVQVGITVVGASAAAFGGASLARDFGEVLSVLPLIGAYGDDIALALVVALVSYLSLVLGELVPKSIALSHPEVYALIAGRPLLWISFLTKPLAWLLTASSNLVLRPLGDRTTFGESRLSREELRQLVEEAAKTGAVEASSGEIAARALEFDQLTASDIMVPRSRIDGIPLDAPPEEVKRRLLETGHTRMPVYDGTLDSIVGYITAKDVLALAWEGQLIILADVIRPTHFVPYSAPAPRLLKDLRGWHASLAFVVDEHGGLVGLVTLEDLIEELVGEIFTEHSVPEQLVRREPDGSALVHGSAPIRAVNRELGTDLPEGDSSTIAGLCMEIAGRIPQRGTRLETPDGTLIEIVEASPRSVRLVRLTWRRESSPEA
jgi:putative hemolysin